MHGAWQGVQDVEKFGTEHQNQGMRTTRCPPIALVLHRLLQAQRCGVQYCSPEVVRESRPWSACHETDHPSAEAAALEFGSSGRQRLLHILCMSTLRLMLARKGPAKTQGSIVSFMFEMCHWWNRIFTWGCTKPNFLFEWWQVGRHGWWLDGGAWAWGWWRWFDKWAAWSRTFPVNVPVFWEWIRFWYWGLGSFGDVELQGLTSM